VKASRKNNVTGVEWSCVVVKVLCVKSKVDRGRDGRWWVVVVVVDGEQEPAKGVSIFMTKDMKKGL
jgi:hypothetical protein